MIELAMADFVRGRADTALRDRNASTCLFEITPTCNLRCGFCYVALDPYQGPYLSTDQVCRVIDKIEQAGILRLTLTGGEILSRRDLPEIYRHARRAGLLVTLYTNATLMNEKLMRLFRDEPPHCVEVSIYGADAEHYERVTGIKGSFARFERGVDFLQEAGVSLILKHPASNLTQDHIPAIRAWCEKRGVPYRLGFTIENRHDGGQQPSLYRIMPRRVNELEAYKYEAINGRPRDDLPLAECSSGGGEGSSERLYQCGAGRIGVFIDALGNASHCVLDREPSFPVLEMSWDEVWRGIGEWVDQPLPADAPCSGCGLRAGCNNCPARSRAATGSPYLKDTYRCDITHEMHGLPPAVHPDYRQIARPVGACAR
jgi:MoaA/NifB/PqqE/SkfB family radical SAM enzyme